MPWNWELPDWPQFNYDPSRISQKEREFLLNTGSSLAYLKNIGNQERDQFIVEILSSEGVESSKIEGEFLDRESLQSSIRMHFGIAHSKKREARKESRMAQLLLSVYETFQEPLSHQMLWEWHGRLFDHDSALENVGKYRMHLDPMQIVSSRFGSPTIFYEAPPSNKVPEEMERFVHWFNSTRTLPILERASIAHLYFESIHPFEDGNGRIGRLLVEKVLSQGIQQPILIAVSRVLEARRKEYYAALETCNRTLKVDRWIEFFAEAIVQAQKESLNLLYFLIEKSKLFSALSKQLNPRQEKALLRMFEEGPNGFKGGLSAENYIAITKASKATATRDLSDLVQKGALVKTGELRHTRYWLNIPGMINSCI